MPPEKTFRWRGDGVWGTYASKESIFGLAGIEGSLGECRSTMDWAGKHALAWHSVGFFDSGWGQKTDQSAMIGVVLVI